MRIVAWADLVQLLALLAFSGDLEDLSSVNAEDQREDVPPGTDDQSHSSVLDVPSSVLLKRLVLLKSKKLVLVKRKNRFLLKRLVTPEVEDKEEATPLVEEEAEADAEPIAALELGEEAEAEAAPVVLANLNAHTYDTTMMIYNNGNNKIDGNAEGDSKDMTVSDEHAHTQSTTMVVYKEESVTQ